MQQLLKPYCYEEYFFVFFISLSTLPAVADEYIDPETNVIYVYQQGVPNATVKCGDVAYWDTDDTEYVSGNPDAKGNVRILDRFTVNGEEYVVNSVGDLHNESRRDDGTDAQGLSSLRDFCVVGVP